MSILRENWNLDSIYPGKSRSEKLSETMEWLEHEIELLKEALKTSSNDNEKLANLLKNTQQVLSTWQEVDDFLVCAYAENVNDPEPIRLMDENSVLKAKLVSFQAELDQLLAKIDDSDWLEFVSLHEMEAIAFYLEERRQRIKDRLPLEMEQLISALSTNGFEGWEQQHEQMLTDMRVTLAVGGGMQEVTIGQALNQAMYSSDRTLRKQAASALEEAYESHEDLFASVLNRIAGFRIDVYKQRGWQSLLKEAAEQNRIKEPSIEAMNTAIDQHKSLFNAYIQRKMELEKISDPSWFDISSPFFTLEEMIPYTKARDIIIRQFSAFNKELGEFAEHVFDADWIEAENRPGKAEGGFCASLPIAKESRIFVTYRENYQDVVTLAHELGHAYHNKFLHEELGFAQEKGTGVAETASTFMENLVLDAAIQGASSKQEKLALLELKISNGLKYVATVPNMFKFELKFYEKRKNGLLAASEIKQLMTETEKEFFAGTVHKFEPYKWMYISHFYDTEKAFYNIPYTIGYLFSNGIYSIAKIQGKDFMGQYNELLKNSGRMTIEELAEKYLGQNLATTSFWEDSLQPLIQSIEEYMELTETDGRLDR